MPNSLTPGSTSASSLQYKLPKVLAEGIIVEELNEIRCFKFLHLALKGNTRYNACILIVFQLHTFLAEARCTDEFQAHV